MKKNNWHNIYKKLAELLYICRQGKRSSKDADELSLKKIRLFSQIYNMLSVKVNQSVKYG